MTNDQQFCLRWNNHQSTLVAVFDTLLEQETLVDCTLAAEGQFIKAHKVVLSACSPYFQLLLSQHFEKHPIIILKDVKFQEMKAMIEYMYRGEVNISQDHLGALLKAAESLQIKGLSDNGRNEKEGLEKKRESVKPQTPRTPSFPSHSGLSVENRRPVNHSTPIERSESPQTSMPYIPPREECASPVARKRKKHRRQSSVEDHNLSSLHDGLENGSSSELPPQNQFMPNSTSLPATITPIPLPSKPATPAAPAVEEKIEPELRPVTKVEPPSLPTPPPAPEIDNKAEPHSEVKAEFVDENEDVEDLTIDDEDEMDSQPGPSHSVDGQGFSSWHMADQSRDEDLMGVQEAMGHSRDSQDNSWLDNNLLFTAFEQILTEGPPGAVSHLTNNVDMSQFINMMPPPVEEMDTTPQIRVIRKSAISQLKESASGKALHRNRRCSDKIYQCTKCYKTYRYLRSLQTHMSLECGSKSSSKQNQSEERASKQSQHEEKAPHVKDRKVFKKNENVGLYQGNDKAVLQDNDKPAQQINDKPAQQINDKPAQQINDKPAQQSNEIPAQQINDKPAQQSNEKLVLQHDETAVHESDQVTVSHYNEKSPLKYENGQ